MATHVRDDAAIQPVADICASIAGALDSDPEAKHLAPTWDALAAKGDTLGNARRAAERALARARARLAVMDVSWDLEIAAFGRDIVDQSGGKRDRAPYTRFFKTVAPSAVQEFGIDREVKNGQDWLAELAREPNEPIAMKWRPRLGAVTENLDIASKNRHDALRAVALQDMAEELFISDVNREIDIVEGDLQKLFPGQPKRVAAFLEATKPRRKRSPNSDSSDSAEG